MLLSLGNDGYFYFLFVGLALVFFFAAWLVPSAGSIVSQGYWIEDNIDAEGLYSFGRLLARLRTPMFFLLSGMFWFGSGIMTEALNNCSDTYHQCYAELTYTNTTTVLPTASTQFTWGMVGMFTFFSMFAISMFFFIFAIITIIKIHAKEMDTTVKRVTGSEMN